MKWSWKIGSLAGIDIRVHATFLLLVAWVGWANYMHEHTWGAALRGVLLIALLFAIVVLHELGHALMARRYGVPTRDITLLPIGGVARLERMPDNPRHELAVAVAGPAVNVVLAAFFAAVAIGLGLPLDPTADVPLGWISQLLWINIGLAAFNMIPAFPMDGGRALRALLALRTDSVRATEIAAGLGQALAILFGIFGLFTSPVLLFIAIFVWMGAQAEVTTTQVKSLLAGITVRDAAISDYEVVAPTDPLEGAVGHIIRGFQHDFPVVEGGRVVGLLPYRSLLRSLRERGSSAPVHQAMEPATFVGPDERLEQVLPRLQSAPCRCLLVVDARGALVGILSLENVGELVAVRRALSAVHHPPVQAQAA